MPRYVLTGAPGSGKTAVLRALELDGWAVVEEAATDVIALAQAQGRPEPWLDAGFVDDVLRLQLLRAAGAGVAAFFDRSPVCTLALAGFLDVSPSPDLLAAARQARDVYAQVVFFVRNQGFVHPTAARTITFEDSLVFERLHERTYRELGFEVVDVPAGTVAERARLVRDTVDRLRSADGRG